MTDTDQSNYEKALSAFSENDWETAIENVLSSIHEVDLNAVRIWFRFYPLSLREYILSAEDREAVFQGMALQGDWDLAEQIDTSHRFLYGSRFWPEIKKAVLKRVDEFVAGAADLEEEIFSVAETAAHQLAVDKSLTLGISAVGLMTLRQVGADKFSSTSGEGYKPEGLLKKSPGKIVDARTSEPSRGVLGFLKTVDKEYKVIWDENDKRAEFEIIYDEEIASAAARDQSRDWLEGDKRCIEGVIPVECRSAACGTCWVGVLGGEENLADVEPLERKQMKVFGYGQKEESKPFMRLACQASAEGSVSIVIPPWNGVFGKKVYGNVEKIELEPATTSAAKLRETISDVLDN
ncbi:MAG: (2Fe-2S)-binding protein [Acidobacteria bacterium]|nr:MAG: (2Fe-2S)-binding protein [Acidobacteriota bacterium]REK02551.1 MAG: (2Fe-2S)-binding protein [Acidobacteriota bacterium]REK13646.1 MAG: (2Fe-2S)-binding protein [Acidobacteriota bacterium]REK41640.1 MAG: (2Fe-2S)-binding protein [Acidobacteriota bacterium]